MTISETGTGTLSTRSAGGDRLSGDMAVDPFHRIGRGERQTAGEHLIERDAERIKIAARVDRAIHPPGLLRRHIGERAGDHLGRLGRLPLARQTRGDAEPGEPHPSVGAVHQDIGRLDVLVDEAALVRLAQRGDDADGEAQEASRLHRRADESLERLAAGSSSSSAVRPRSRASASGRSGPRGVELVPQFIFVGEAIEASRRRALRGGQHGQHRAAAAVAVRAPSPAEHAFAILPQDLEVADPIRVVLKRRI